MRTRWVPPYYQRELLQKLQRLRQGKNSVEEYYQELQTGMIRCGIVEENEAMLARFLGGLNREIQTILDYRSILISLVYSILLVKLNVKCRIDKHWGELTFLQADLHHGHHVHLLLQLHQHLHPVPPPAVIQENRHNHHYLPRAHLRGLHSVLLLPWHQQGTQVILFVVVVREEVIMRGNANLRV